MRVSVCVGNYAKTPYCVPGLGMNVYCMEELSFLLKENAFLVDVSLMNDGLLRWIDEECGMRELARSLYPLVHKKGSLSAFVVTLLSEVGFLDAQTIAEVESVLKQGAGLSRIEKRKSQIDHLLKKRKYLAAMKEYDGLITFWEEQGSAGEQLPAVECLASIYHNKGVALAGLMIYGEAAECFETAWHTDGSQASYRAFLAAKRMQLTEEEYVAFAAERSEAYELTMELERDMEGYVRQWEEQPEYLRLYSRQEWKQNGDMQRYFEENERITQILKDNYRSCVSD